MHSLSRRGNWSAQECGSTLRGRYHWKTDTVGATANSSYDKAGNRIAAIADSDVFTYGKSRRILTAVSGRYTNTVAYSYDTAGRKKTEGLTITARGELYQLKHAGTTVDTWTYDYGGRLVTDAYNNTVTESRTYNLELGQHVSRHHRQQVDWQFELPLGTPTRTSH